jgi:hypothetical protein
MYIGYFVYENDLGYFFIEFFVNFVITYMRVCKLYECASL